jgi:membrane-bound metal-dependent hydrolase YbcI (DUF457 family)
MPINDCESVCLLCFFLLETRHWRDRETLAKYCLTHTYLSRPLAIFSPFLVLRLFIYSSESRASSWVTSVVGSWNISQVRDTITLAYRWHFYREHCQWYTPSSSCQWVSFRHLMPVSPSVPLTLWTVTDHCREGHRSLKTIALHAKNAEYNSRGRCLSLPDLSNA